MSAFLCSARHIGTIAAYAFTVRVLPTRAAARKFASDLNRLNIESLRRRYGAQETIPLKGRNSAINEALEPLSSMNIYGPEHAAAYAFALITCLKYQCDSADDSPIYRDLCTVLSIANDRRGSVVDGITWEI